MNRQYTESEKDKRHVNCPRRDCTVSTPTHTKMSFYIFCAFDDMNFHFYDFEKHAFSGQSEWHMCELVVQWSCGFLWMLIERHVYDGADELVFERWRCESVDQRYQQWPERGDAKWWKPVNGKKMQSTHVNWYPVCLCIIDNRYWVYKERGTSGLMLAFSINLRSLTDASLSFWCLCVLVMRVNSRVFITVYAGAHGCANG